MESLFAGLFGMLLGLAGIGTGFYQLRNVAALKNWRQTAGRIVVRDVHFYEGSMMSPPAFRYAPLIKYAYQVEGREYTSDAIHARRVQMPEHSSRRWAEKKAASFADEVTVYYNPQAPDESFLLHSSKTKLCLMIAGAGIAFLLGLAFLAAWALG